MERPERGIGLDGRIQRVREAPPLAQRQPQDRVARGDGGDAAQDARVELCLLGERVQQRDVGRHPGRASAIERSAERLEGRRQRDDEDEGGLGAGRSAPVTPRARPAGRCACRSGRPRTGRAAAPGSGAAGSVIRSLFT